MIINIEPLSIAGLDCFENAIYSILNWKFNEYEMGFIGLWSFPYNYTEQSDILGDKLNSDTSEESLKNLSEYYGTDLIIHKKEAIEHPYDNIKKEISNNLPVVLFLDTYYCHWHMDYHSRHKSHFCTVVGIDKNGDFVCVDSMTKNSKNLILCYDDFSNGCGDMITFKFSKRKTSDIDLKSILSGCIKNLGLFTADNAFKNMRYFAKRLENSSDISNEFKGYKNLWETPLCKNIDIMCGRRVQMRKLMEYLEGVYCDDILPAMIEQFSAISYKWTVLRTVFYKTMITKGADELHNLADRLREISDLEEKTAKIIYNYTQDKAIGAGTNHGKSEIPGSYVYLNLNDFFNNKGFSSPNASFSKTGQYFLYDGLPSTKIWSVNGMKFIAPDVYGTEYDNISCANQVIKIPDGVYRSIMLLTCAEWGSFVDNVTVNYRDKTSEMLEIAVSDLYGEPDFQETVAWKGKFVDKASYEILTGKLYAETYKINKDGRAIESVSLPNCNNIHIFSITLAH